MQQSLSDWLQSDKLFFLYGLMVTMIQSDIVFASVLECETKDKSNIYAFMISVCELL